jgi:dTDP-4-dehydrorhamnose reductase
MRALVTGVSGQVGGALLAPLGEFSTVLPIDERQLDLAQTGTIAASLDRLAPDLIVNPAAYTAVDRAEDEKELAFRVNAEAPGAIARWAAVNGVPLVHFSTDYVFDGSGDKRWQEDSRTGPLSVYGASKLAGELAVRDAGGPHLIVRTSWVYAARGANFLRTIARLAREREQLRVVADQFGAPTSARVIAEATACILKGNISNLPAAFARGGSMVNVVCAGETSWHGFAVAIVAGLADRGINLSVKKIIPIGAQDYPTAAKRPGNSRLDLTRLRSVYGIEPQSWSDALEVELDLLSRELA